MMRSFASLSASSRTPSMFVVAWLLSTTFVSNSPILVVNGEETIVVDQQQQQSNPTTTYNRTRFDKDWTEYNRNDFWYAFDCPQVFQRPNSGLVPTDATFHYLRDTYRAIVGDERSSIHIEPLTTTTEGESEGDKDDDDDETSNKKHSIGYGGRGGFHVQGEARRTKDHGRGVFAIQNIPKGTLIWDTKYTARFPDAKTYRQFLLSISPDLACEVMPWTYIQKSQPTNNQNNDGSELKQPSHVISLDTDYGALMNGGIEMEDATSNDDYANIGCNKDTNGLCVDGNYYALRDIKPGEELFVNYHSFNVLDAWKDVSLECTVCDVTA